MKKRPPTRSLSSTANSRPAWSTHRTKSNEFSGCSRIEQRRSTITGHWNARLPCCALKSSESNRSVLLPAAASPSQTSLFPCAKSAPRPPKPSERSFEAPPPAVFLASPLPMGLPRSRGPQEFLTHPPGGQAERISSVRQLFPVSRHYTE